MERSEVSLEGSPAGELTVLGAVAQVFQLQLQLPNADVLLGQLLFQSPDLILLPEEHSEELRWKKKRGVAAGRERAGEKAISRERVLRLPRPCLRSCHPFSPCPGFSVPRGSCPCSVPFSRPRSPLLLPLGVQHRPLPQISRAHPFRGADIILLFTILNGNLSKMFCILLFLRKLRYRMEAHFSAAWGTISATKVRTALGFTGGAGMGKAGGSDSPSLRQAPGLTSLALSTGKQTARCPQNTEARKAVGPARIPHS